MTVGVNQHARPQRTGRIQDAAETRFVPIVVFLIVLGVAFRLFLIWTTTSPQEHLNRMYPGYTDGEEYMDNARSLVDHGVYGYNGRLSAFRPPAYPFLIALSWRCFGDGLTPIRIVQVGCFAAMAILYVQAVTKHFGRLAGILSAGLFSLYPLFAFMTTEIATESLYMVLASSVFALSFPLLDPGVSTGRKTAVALASGLCCGIGTLTRPNMFALFGLLVALIVAGGWVSRAGWRACLPPLLGVTVGVYAVLLPWMIRNERRLGAPVVTTNLDYNLFRGTFDLVEGVRDGADIEAVFRNHGVVYEEVIEDVRTGRLPVGEVQNERNAWSAALAIIRADPADWLWQRARNAAYLWLNLQWDSSLLHRGPVVFLAATSVTLIYYLLLVGALLGSLLLWRAPRNRQQRIFLVVAWLYMAAATPMVLTFVGKRYRVSTIDPYLVLLVSAALAHWLGRRRETPVDALSPRWPDA